MSAPEEGGNLEEVEGKTNLMKRRDGVKGNRSYINNDCQNE